MTKKRRQRLMAAALLLISAGLLLVSGLTVWATTLPIPDFAKFFEERAIAQSTKIYDRTGTILLYDVHSEIKRTVVPLEEVNPYAQKASIAIEDENFYTHNGIQPLSIVRAVLVDILTGELQQGGSTITQQVIKLTILNNQKKFSRKIKEVVLALKLEREMTKDQILSLYLNEAPYGGSLYGIEVASKSFFGKSAKDLSLPEAAYLAAIPQAPTYYSPYGDHRDKLDERKNLVLDRMSSLKFITKEEAKTAKETKVSFLPPEDRGIRAPHFVFYVKSYLEEKYGKDVVEEGGLTITTTLDWKLQQSAEERVKSYGQQNKENFAANNMGLVAIDPKTGQILAMVGSVDYFDIENEGNFNITLARRQPGSAFKPFVYATAFEKGYTPETMVFDVPTQFSTNCPPDCYTPQNYDDKFVGPISLKDALAQSRNIPAVKTLYLAGINSSLQTARNFGITTLTDKNRYGLTLVLGGGEVSLLELTSAYSVFANDGVRNPPEKILEVKDANGKILEKFDSKSKQVVEPNVARQINSILSDNDARRPLFGNTLSFNRQVALKTGTTNDYRDAWVVGYTPNLVVGAWAGNNNNKPMEKKVAGLIIVPMWNDFIRNTLSFLSVESFIPPSPTSSNLKPILRGFWQGGETYTIDKTSGKLATEFTPPENREERVSLNPHSILYWVNKDNPQGPNPTNPNRDPQFNTWEEAVQKWVIDHGINTGQSAIIPNNYDDIHTSQSGPQFEIQISNPDNNGQTLINLKNISSQYPITQADFFLNGNFLGSAVQVPYNFSFNNSTLNQNGVNIVKVIIYDSIKNKAEKQLNVNL